MEIMIQKVGVDDKRTVYKLRKSDIALCFSPFLYKLPLNKLPDVLDKKSGEGYSDNNIKGKNISILTDGWDIPVSEGSYKVIDKVDINVKNKMRRYQRIYNEKNVHMALLCTDEHLYLGFVVFGKEYIENLHKDAITIDCITDLIRIGELDDTESTKNSIRMDLLTALNIMQVLKDYNMD